MDRDPDRGTRFRASTTWVIDFRHDGHPRRWFRTFGRDVDVPERIAAELAELHGDRARLVEVRPATAAEESQYLRGEEPKNVLCPTGRRARDDADDAP
jgi:hypothetical protein